MGEVERLLKEYRQNQELVRRIGKHYYQIIYPVQLRHHEKMGISTREVGASKTSQVNERAFKLKLMFLKIPIENHFDCEGAMALRSQANIT
ncbi:hypothetical protein Bhyg_09690 [Pseudolycoriella hygida]|uniref:Uncharacterized protein n=1 Tax=Pseudolycoriella hygida TaxID=35572 RepID=A0A9Q0MTR6_9DIPT|nr:hypothetical protein Bhyg_09690 [Pseudolycoriella hygida]